MYKSKMELFGLFICITFFVLFIFNQPSLADRLLPNHANYFEIEVIDSFSAGSTYTHNEKFFPFGWWYTPYDTVPVQIDYMKPDTNKYNVFMPSWGVTDSVLLKHLKYGISDGPFDRHMYGFGTFPKLLYGHWWFFDRFDEIHPDYSKNTNDSILCSYGWVEFCDSVNSSDYEILNTQLNDELPDSVVVVNCLHITSTDTNFTLTYIPDSVTGAWRTLQGFDESKMKLNWLSFKIASDKMFRDSSYTTIFIAKYYTHKYGDTEDTATIYIELNSNFMLPDSQYYDTLTNTITVSLQNTDYFSDVDESSNPDFPLYDRNPKDIVDLYDEEGYWFLVFAMMDSIIYNYTDSVGTPYILDSLVEFKLIGTHYYMDQFAYIRDPHDVVAECADFMSDNYFNPAVFDTNCLDSVIAWWYRDEPVARIIVKLSIYPVR